MVSRARADEQRRLDEGLELLPEPSWRSLLEALAAVPAHVAVFVGPQHLLAFQSRVSVAVSGPRPIGRPAAEAFEDFPEYVAALDRAWTGDHPLHVERAPVRGRPAPDRPTEAGPARMIDAVFAPLRDPRGRTFGVIGHAVDVADTSGPDERVRIADALSRVGMELTRSLDVGQVTAAVTRLAAEVFSGWALLDLWQPDGTLARAGTTHHDPAMQPLIEKLRFLPRISGRPDHAEPYSMRSARTGRSFVGELDVASLVAVSTTPEQADVMSRLRPRWFQTVPVQIGPRRLGAITVVRPEGEPPFEPGDRFVLEQFAERAAIGLAHARDYAEQRQAALTLQRSLLPPPPRPGGLQLAVRYRAGGSGVEVGGDWYDTVELGHGVVGLAVGDVEGHDVTAAALMGQVRAIVHSHARAGLPPARIAREANLFVTDSLSERLVTFTYLQVHPDDGLVVWIRAGHLPALAVLPDGRSRLLAGRGGLPLGVEADGRWEEETLVLPPGSLLAICTDGLVESPDRGLEQGLAQLADLLASRPGGTIDELADAALEELAGRDVHDDVALVMMRLPSSEARERRISRRLPSIPSSAPVARRFLLDVLGSWSLPAETVDTAGLLLTELVSNAVRHSDESIDLRLAIDEHRLRVGVFDESHRLPLPAPVGVESTSGRGLQLIDAMSSGWGVEMEDAGKVVWFEMEI